MDFCRLLSFHYCSLNIFISLSLLPICFRITSCSTADVVKRDAVSTIIPPIVDTNTTTDASKGNFFNVTPTESTTIDFSYLQHCPDNVPCENLGASCINCKLNYYCVYGKTETTECTVKQNITCLGSRTFKRPYHCRYGYQLDADKISCAKALMGSNCQMKQAPPQTFITYCTVKEEEICLGNRTFLKKFPCNWTSGFKWSTALALSVTLGGFGVDRFYIGLWRSGIGKLFSFGGLGVWTIVDVVLIAVGYVGPHDGSLYIYPWD
ncbi:TM2 domain-containing protein 3-like [Ruditapes philippinarum]|uniref:TM2 domain-containing protein 3-like n=1 Tax=Ruditapes philippinarum TaxID=129788 RepID=UPI00295C1101|nr:TM2 domain-containing protein 3-like [Ruditapes philippinarum]